jgi:hypothetical protein
MSGPLLPTGKLSWPKPNVTDLRKFYKNIYIDKKMDFYHQ